MESTVSSLNQCAVQCTVLYEAVFKRQKHNTLVREMVFITVVIKLKFCFAWYSSLF